MSLAQEVIDQLKKGIPGTSGRLILEHPITNIPVHTSDYQAGKLIDYLLKEVLPEKTTLEELLLFLADVSWWIFSVYSKEPYDDFVKLRGRPSGAVIKAMEYFEKNFPEDISMGEITIVLAETQWWMVFFFAFNKDLPYQDVSKLDDALSHLTKINRKAMLLNALRHLVKLKQFQTSPAWYAISELCAVGSTTATFIGLEIPLDPSAPLKKALDHYDKVKHQKPQ